MKTKYNFLKSMRCSILAERALSLVMSGVLGHSNNGMIGLEVLAITFSQVFPARMFVLCWSENSAVFILYRFIG